MLKTDEEKEILGGTLIEDEDLDRIIRDMGDEEVMVYGDLSRELDNDEKSILRLNPKMATFERVTRKGVRGDVEEAFAEIRYNRIFEGEDTKEVEEGVEITDEEREKFEQI